MSITAFNRTNSSDPSFTRRSTSTAALYLATGHFLSEASKHWFYFNNIYTVDQLAPADVAFCFLSRWIHFKDDQAQKQQSQPEVVLQSAGVEEVEEQPARRRKQTARNDWRPAGVFIS